VTTWLRAWVRHVAAWLDSREGQVLDRVAPEEIGNAVRVLYGTRHARRKRQRKRRHVTYKQRDAIAWLLIRLHHERTERTEMNRQEWMNQFRAHMSGVSDFTDTDIVDASEVAADEQQERTGTDDAAMWQPPMAAAQTTLNEWNREEAEALDAAPYPPGWQGEPGTTAGPGAWLPPDESTAPQSNGEPHAVSDDTKDTNK